MNQFDASIIISRVCQDPSTLTPKQTSYLATFVLPSHPAVFSDRNVSIILYLIFNTEIVPPMYDQRPQELDRQRCQNFSGMSCNAPSETKQISYFPYTAQKSNEKIYYVTSTLFIRDHIPRPGATHLAVMELTRICSSRALWRKQRCCSMAPHPGMYLTGVSRKYRWMIGAPTPRDKTVLVREGIGQFSNTFYSVLENAGNYRTNCSPIGCAQHICQDNLQTHPRGSAGREAGIRKVRTGIYSIGLLR